MRAKNMLKETAVPPPGPAPAPEVAVESDEELDERKLVRAMARARAGAPLTLGELARAYGGCTKTIQRMIKRGAFPEAAIKPNKRVHKWTVEQYAPLLKLTQREAA